jgi:3-phytase
MRRSFAVIMLLTIGGCRQPSQAPRAAETAEVQAVAETEPVGTTHVDAADDPAIWRNAANPAASLIVATDKRAGLYVYGLDGKKLAFDPAGRLNNVDLIDFGDEGVIVAASDRNDPTNAKLQLYQLMTTKGVLGPLGSVTGGAGEAYGVCLWRDSDALYAFSVLKQGIVHQVRIDLAGKSITGKIVRTMRLKSQAESCVVDPRTRQLYVGEESGGIWRYYAGSDGPPDGQLVAKVDRRQLVPDVEGLTLAPDGADGGWLIASSQGDSAFAVYRLPDLSPAGRFRIVRGKLGSVEDTDGIAVTVGDFGPDFPGGLFVAQDGENESRAQNFKLVPWAAIRSAIDRR